jgi:hypothetical protein
MVWQPLVRQPLVTAPIPAYLRNQQEVGREPGYSIGTGAAGISGAW